MATRKQTITKRADAPQKQCAYCSAVHSRRGIYCSDNCKLKAFRARQKEGGETVSETVSLGENVIAFPPTQQSSTPILSDEIGLLILAELRGLREDVRHIPAASAPPQPSHAPRPKVKMTVSEDADVEIEVSKANGGGAEVVNNYLNSLFAMTGAEVAIAQPDPRTIKINGQDTSVAQGIKRMEVPQFAPPSFDDDEL